MIDSSVTSVLGYSVNNFRSVEDAATFFIERRDSIELGEYVCLANVHMFVEAIENESFSKVLKEADFVLPDGMPIALLARYCGDGSTARVRGMDLTKSLLLNGARAGKKFGFYGASQDVLCKLIAEVEELIPNVQIAYSYSPPFRELSDVELESVVTDINCSAVDFLFVGLGCPKQERWMKENAPKLNCLCFGVGAVFDFLAKTAPEAPRWVSNVGFEWLFRLMVEPRRLFKRYFKTNLKFLVIVLTSFLRLKRNT